MSFIGDIYIWIISLEKIRGERENTSLAPSVIGTSADSINSGTPVQTGKIWCKKRLDSRISTLPNGGSSLPTGLRSKEDVPRKMFHVLVCGR